MGEIIAGYYPGAIGRIVEMHGAYYHLHWGFGLFFETKVATELSQFMNRFEEGRDGLWTIEKGEGIAGAIAIDGIKADESEGAHLRWFIIDPQLQRQGWGRRLLNEAVAFCDGKGYRKIYLWTFQGLSSARHLYEATGFRLVFQKEGEQWGTKVTEQLFERFHE
ncbi:MAG: GNAT family N-acetyltransferase [Syntrophales bacterium]|jgi:GNAT superfamily N-acetyltransferase|nr:GNAT family N-acetyltransferase [Syntrophales bacterium]